MKLNYDCVRDVLLKLEEILSCAYLEGGFYFESITINQLKDELSNNDYDIEDIFYAAYNLEQANYIDAYPINADGQIVEYLIHDITYEGHQFIEQIRPKTIWDKSKPVFKNLGAISIDIIKSVTSTIISDTINHYIPKS